MNTFQVPSLLNGPSENKIYLPQVVSKQSSNPVEDVHLKTSSLNSGSSFQNPSGFLEKVGTCFLWKN